MTTFHTGVQYFYYANIRIPAGPPVTATPSMTSNNFSCPKCGATKMSGTLSCCARGGAWFKNCGDVDNAKFEHTWVEGIRACEDVDNSISVKSTRQVMLHGVGPIAHSLNISHQETSSIRTSSLSKLSMDSLPNAGALEYMSCDGSVKVIVFVFCIRIIS